MKMVNGEKIDLMKSEGLALQLIKEMQEARGVPTFVLASGINLRTLVQTRVALLDIPHSDEIDIILQSPGGDPATAYRLIRTFRERYDTVNIIVPFWAKSAATIFAFGGSRIVLHEFGELGPLDAQIRQEDDDGSDARYASALNVQSSLQQIEDRARLGVIEMYKTINNNPDIRIGKKQLLDTLLTYSSHFYEPLLQKIETTEIGIMARYLSVGSMYARRILKQYTDISDDDLEELLNFLVYESPDHGYVVDYSILHQYLKTAVHAREEPFGGQYYEYLEQLSMLLMRSDIDKVGFVDTLLPEESDGDTIETDTKETTDNEKRAGTPKSKTKRVNRESDKDKRAKKPRKNTPRSAA